MDQPYAVEEDGLLLTVRVTPRARKSEVTGVVSDADGRPALAVRLAAPPVEGAANKALIAFLAGLFDIPKSAISIHSGETARLKRLFLRGATLETARNLTA